MATDIGVGDSETADLVVAPADVSTVVTLTVHKPDGTAADVAMTGGDLVVIPDTIPVQYSQRWTSDTPVVYDQAGRWVLTYAVTGTGEGAEPVEVWVVASPVAGGPTWAPGRSRVAAYVPHRTLGRSTSSVIDSQDQYALTFDDTTRPSGTTVDRLINDGIDWITALVTPLHASSQPACALLSALWAAVSVERSWPNDDQSLQRASDMEKRMDTLLTALITANQTANDQANDTGDYAIDVAPMWAFSSADPRYDYPTYW